MLSVIFSHYTYMYMFKYIYIYKYMYKIKKKTPNNIAYIVKRIIYMIVERYLLYCIAMLTVFIF